MHPHMSRLDEEILLGVLARPKVIEEMGHGCPNQYADDAAQNACHRKSSDSSST